MVEVMSVAASESVRAIASRSEPGLVSVFHDVFRVITHNVGLRADGDQPVDVLADGHEHLAGHVPALLRPGRLVFDVNAGGTLLHEHLGELHDRRDAAVSGVGISDDGSQEVRVRELRALGLWHAEALLALLAIVEELGEPEVLHLVRHGGLPG
jgi:hypothetical protein